MCVCLCHSQNAGAGGDLNFRAGTGSTVGGNVVVTGGAGQGVQCRIIPHTTCIVVLIVLSLSLSGSWWW